MIPPPEEFYSWVFLLLSFSTHAADILILKFCDFIFNSLAACLDQSQGSIS